MAASAPSFAYLARTEDALAPGVWYVSLMVRFEESGASASQALLSAALGGLLCVASSCGGSTSSSTSAASTAASSAAGSSAPAAVAADPDTPVPATECDGGVPPNPQITSTVTGALTKAQFVSMCSTQNGIFELQPNCSGSNACRGMSYDSELQILIGHTCRGLNSCAGFSCVVCD